MSIMGKFTKIAALGMSACAMLALAHPASAAEGPAASGAKAVEAASENTNAKKAAAKKYCMRVSLDTGTRISTRECRTKAEWAEYGVEMPTAK
jgi:hypothetical protein